MISAVDSKEIGKALTALLQARPNRIRIRQSVNDGSVFSACSESATIKAVTCPKQTGHCKNCGDCGLCLLTTKPVRFLDHGRNPGTDSMDNILQYGTIFPNNIQNPTDVPQHISILKDGNDKTGDLFTKGFWKGYNILSLTLTERKTCAFCHHWRECYANNMFRAVRYNTDGLIDRLTVDLAKLNPSKKYAIRLHILGDFWSIEYVNFWADVIKKYDNINIFGFTAHDIDNGHLKRK
jgi:hypothetical protein